jgi:TRAP-type C4-dicarboxylate transport system permease small subunit
MSGSIGKAVRHVECHLEESIACFCLAVIAVCVFMQVVLRYGFGIALTWTEELAGFCMAWAVYMGAALGVRERFHIRILVGVMILPRILQLPLILISDLLWLWFNVAMIWVGIEYIEVLWTRPSISPALGIDQVWPQSIILIGYGLITIRHLQIYVIWWADGRKGLPGMPPEFQEEDPLELERP